ncbi:ATP-binding cassette domain-containing protein [Candidatus Roizmanbacteria bacterium]|nr:ATP-binding cassette domain-containing protein [Candidatus Roizmanbacteria bacterium]
MISLLSVSKQFGQKRAVNKITLETKEGEVIGFLGPNGAGKTTAMRLILGYLHPDFGDVRVDGLHPVENRIELLRQAGYLAENNPLYQEMKVREYLQFIADVKGVVRIEAVSRDVGIEDVLNSKIEELSRGYRQRVGLAAALLADPKLLILDEPTSGLDPLEQEKIRSLIKKLAKKKTIIFSTHILSEIEDVASRLVIINKGAMVYDGKKPVGKGAVEKLFRKLVKE